MGHRPNRASKAPKPPNVRLASFLKSKGWSRVRASKAFLCSPAYVSMLVSGTKLPGRLVSNAIERATVDWSGGQIVSAEWDAVEMARRERGAA